MATVPAGLLVAVVGVLIMMINFSLHKIDEGYVGVYYRVNSNSINVVECLFLTILC